MDIDCLQCRWDGRSAQPNTGTAQGCPLSVSTRPSRKNEHVLPHLRRSTFDNQRSENIHYHSAPSSKDNCAISSLRLIPNRVCRGAALFEVNSGNHYLCQDAGVRWQLALKTRTPVPWLPPLSCQQHTAFNDHGPGSNKYSLNIGQSQDKHARA